MTALLLLQGCAAATTSNPSFPLSIGESRRELREIYHDPKPLQRPVVVIGGWQDPGIHTGPLASAVRRGTGDDRVLVVTVAEANSYDECRDLVLDAVKQRFGRPDIEVDVIAHSMGALVARHAAQYEDPQGRRLHINRLFTTSGPHRGAAAASDAPDTLHLIHEMRPDSELIRTLTATIGDHPFDTYSYARLGDTIVQTPEAIPPGGEVWWVSNPPLHSAHNGIVRDSRVLADILRRLRGEPTYTISPATPPPS